MAEKCDDHSGCLADIRNLKDDQHSQWDCIRQIEIKMANIAGLLNKVLGGVAIACVLLAVNIVLGLAGK